MFRPICVENRKIPTDLRDEALKLQQQTDWDDAGGQGSSDRSGERWYLIANLLFFLIGIVSAEDDEYRWAGVEDPKVIITTSHDPSSKLKQFSKVMSAKFSRTNLIWILIGTQSADT
jgi:U3 small nucleolar ribonucleoprotein protein IMP4